jgi:hypothetical protein
MRVTFISNSNSHSHLSTMPLIGAALPGIRACGQRDVPFAGEQTEVGSSPIQPARRADRPRTRRAGR